ncbi:AraC family transcriptional regulator [Mucilaginibacter ginsenosidivorax]|uniref:AraC family transcriptional regulator n=1 Tax=Mucilaginibacter ginsenosidivorax TaxID=862126 RepID=A0A5B8W9F8_9SPHI|nr:AraC family transcriptional regulator [Mucilaginibacter ginsenosidivorax]QEC78888.1 AraC family transcriptional regulator [Mucilaginibacter ginsenosidivorax]
MLSYLKKDEGFAMHKAIKIPGKLLKGYKVMAPELFKLYITEIGHFPKAGEDSHEEKKGCRDNILIYCVNGVGHLILGDRKYELHGNEYIVIPATDKYIRYWADQKNPWSVYWIYFTGPTIEAFNKALKLDVLNQPLLIHFNEKGLELWTKIYDTLNQSLCFEHICNANFCLYHLLATFLFPQRHNHGVGDDRDIITPTINFMRRNINKKLSVEDMSASLHISASHFAYIFKKATGSSPIDYFNQLKMQRACQLLFQGNDKIKTVASDLGYGDPFYFSRMFKQYIGSSPGQYRISSKHGV